jgi:hypothetical protein
MQLLALWLACCDMWLRKTSLELQASLTFACIEPALLCCALLDVM